MFGPHLRCPTLSLVLSLTLSLLVVACAAPEPTATLEISNAGHMATLGYSALAALPEVEIRVHDHVYRGARLRDVLAAQQLGSTAPLWAQASDGYSQTLSPEILVRDDVIIAYARDGAGLPAEDGPLRLVVPGSPGLSVRRLIRLKRPE